MRINPNLGQRNINTVFEFELQNIKIQFLLFFFKHLFYYF